MSSENPGQGEPDIMSGTLSRLPTGAKLFLILSAALLPLALIGVFAALQMTRNADAENRGRLRIAAIESSRALAIELAGDMAALRSALRAIENDPNDAPSCARTRGVFAPATSAGARFAIYDAAGTLRCGQPIVRGGTAPGATILPGDGLVLTLASAAGSARATAFFPASLLARVSRPSSPLANYGAELQLGSERLTLKAPEEDRLTPRDRMSASTGIDKLAFEMSAPIATITSPIAIAMLLPVLMWAAAAGIGWFVVDRLLIRPLRRLRRSVGDYQPGTVFDPVAVGAIPAQEIRELGATFRGLSQTLAAHESDLAEGLVRQTKLTREVHHRVKNNLQVIASLINFHARSAGSGEVAAAYASIQRRVDALAVVHRNHFAEMEVNRGLSLRAVLGELSANIRATAPEEASLLGITLDVEPYMVSQDTAVAVAFLVTEMVELAMSVNPVAQIRISAQGGASEDRAILRVSSAALVEGDALATLVARRYGRVIEGLSRQLRSKLHHDPLTGAFEIAVLVIGRD